MKRIFPLLVFLLMTFIATASLLVEPTKLEFLIDPLDKTTEAIRVTNITQAPLFVNVNAYDWFLDENRDLHTTKLGSSDSTLSGSVKFNPRQFTLLPGQTQIVRVTITMPQESPPERRAIIFFETEQTSSFGSISTSLETLIGTTIYATSTDADYIFKVLAFTHTLDEKNGLVLHVLTENAGYAHIRCNLSYAIYDQGGYLYDSDDLIDTVILPGEKFVFHLPVKEKLVPGNYRFVGRVTFSHTHELLPFAIPFTI